MEVIKTAIEGLVIIEPRVFKDARGYFFESFSQREFEDKVRKINFVQDNESMSSYGGSSVMFLLIEIGLVLSVAKRIQLKDM